MDEQNMNELEQIKDELSFMRSCFHTSPYVHAEYFIPKAQTWNKESFTRFGLLFENKKYYVTVSSTYSPDPNNHSPNHLFNGKKENQGGLMWATDADLESADIQIDFDSPLIASIILMSSRDGCYLQSPTSFEIFGISEDSPVSLRRFDNVYWTPNETKLFAFYNRRSFSSYKVVFYSKEANHFALSEFNIGKVIRE